MVEKLVQPRGILPNKHIQVLKESMNSIKKKLTESSHRLGSWKWHIMVGTTPITFSCARGAGVPLARQLVTRPLHWPGPAQHGLRVAATNDRGHYAAL